MNNTAYGTTMENLRNAVYVRLVNNEKQYLKWTSKPSSATEEIFYKNSLAINKIIITLRLKNQHMLEYVCYN